ncbi:MAG: DNA oxidative demethylase AlkB [Candidatus Obscuribacterales bacterium]
MDLFAASENFVFQEPLGPGATVLRKFCQKEGQAKNNGEALLQDLAALVETSPFRHMVTPGGFEMSVAMSNCGALGWVTDQAGYRYQAIDPETGSQWSAMPKSFLELASSAAKAGGFDDFVPDACLINRYEVGSRLTLHQDKNEMDFSQPIVSVSLGLPAVFLFGGLERSSPTRKVQLTHGDVAVWGGSSRMNYHGILPLKDGLHELTGSYRYNLTFRKAG